MPRNSSRKTVTKEAMHTAFYFTDLDLSRPDGPTVNEREFIGSLVRVFAGDTTLALTDADAAAPEAAGAEIVPLVETSGGLLRSSLAMLRNALAVRRAFRRSGAPLIIARMTHMPLSLWILTTVLGVRVALKAVGQYWSLTPPNGILDALAWRLQLFLSNSIIRRALSVDTVTPELAGEIRARSGRATVHVVPNATNTQRFSPTDGPKAFGPLDLSACWPVVGFAGTKPSIKAMPQLMSIAESLAEPYPRFAIVVAGWDQDMEAWRAVIAERAWHERFYLLGTVPYDSIPNVINLFDIGVSFGDPARAATVGNASQKVRQYLASGKPVVSMGFGNEFIEKEDLGTLVPPEDFEAAAAAVLDLAGRLEGDPNAFSGRCREYAVKNLSVETTLDARLALWRQALDDISGENR